MVTQQLWRARSLACARGWQTMIGAHAHARVKAAHGRASGPHLRDLTHTTTSHPCKGVVVGGRFRGGERPHLSPTFPTPNLHLCRQVEQGSLRDRNHVDSSRGGGRQWL